MESATRDVPNIRLIFLNNGTQVHTLDCTTIKDYMENFDSFENMDEIYFSAALIDTKDFDFIESKKYSEILIYRSLLMRDVETGEDKLYFPPTLTFHKLNFEYSANVAGDVVDWTIRLQN